MESLYLFIFVLFSTFHTVTTYLFLYCLVRTIFVKYSPYASAFVGGTILANSVYGGCTLTEVENLLARLVGQDQKVVGDIYDTFSDYGGILRVFVFIAAIGFLCNAYKVWNKVENPLRIQNIFMSSPNSLSILS